jgi:excisionase family DNA binding protein
MTDTNTYSTRQAAEVLDLSQSTVQRMADEGTIPSYRTPGGFRRLDAGPSRSTSAHGYRARSHCLSRSAVMRNDRRGGTGCGRSPVAELQRPHGEAAALGRLQGSGAALRVRHRDARVQGQPRAISPRRADFGLFQFNRAAWSRADWWDERQLLDGAYSAAVAYKLSQGGRTWYPWDINGRGYHLKRYSSTSTYQVFVKYVKAFPC